MPLDDFYDDAQSRGGAWTKLKEVGDAIVGDLISIDVRDRRDPQGNVVLARKTGKPRKSYVITIQTDQRDGADDDGVRKFDANEAAQSAIIDAYRKAGGGDIAGARIGIQLTAAAPDSMSQASYACSIRKQAKPVTIPAAGSSIDELV